LELPGTLLGQIDKEEEKVNLMPGRTNLKKISIKKGGQNEKGKMGSM
jgi:hypothetical protein